MGKLVQGRMDKKKENCASESRLHVLPAARYAVLKSPRSAQPNPRTPTLNR